MQTAKPASVSSLNATIKWPTLHEKTAGFEAGLVQLDRLLDRHFNDEKDLNVPVILKFGAPQMGQPATAQRPPREST